MMKTPKLINALEKVGGVFSETNYGLCNGNLAEYLNGKKLERVFEKGDLNQRGKLSFDEIIYKSRQDFYLYIKLVPGIDEVWSLTIYYKPEQQNELVLFITQLLKPFINATNNN
jgi:hypothetical protein